MKDNETAEGDTFWAPVVWAHLSRLGLSQEPFKIPVVAIKVQVAWRANGHVLAHTDVTDVSCRVSSWVHVGQGGSLPDSPQTGHNVLLGNALLFYGGSFS
jgi:hypothetical protein